MSYADDLERFMGKGLATQKAVDAALAKTAATYLIGKKDGQQWIKCLVCGRTSHHPQDVANLYCGYCHQFHLTGEAAQKAVEAATWPDVASCATRSLGSSPHGQPTHPSPCCGKQTEWIARRGERDLRRCPCGMEHVI